MNWLLGFQLPYWCGAGDKLTAQYIRGKETENLKRLKSAKKKVIPSKNQYIYLHGNKKKNGTA